MSVAYRDCRPAKDLTAEDQVVEAAWRKLGMPGMLCLRYRHEPDFAGREIDGVAIGGRPREPIPMRCRATSLSLARKKVWAIEAKAGSLNFGVLGQALVAAELLDRMPLGPAEVVAVAAAPRGNDALRRSAAGFAGRPVRVVLTPAVDDVRKRNKRTKSSEARNPVSFRTAVLDDYAQQTEGLIVGPASGAAAFSRARVQGLATPISVLEPVALHLPDRRRQAGPNDEPWVPALSTIELRPGERVTLVYSQAPLGRTLVGRAVFGVELARRVFHLNASVVAAYPEHSAHRTLEDVLESVRPGARYPLRWTE